MEFFNNIVIIDILTFVAATPVCRLPVAFATQTGAERGTGKLLRQFPTGYDKIKLIMRNKFFIVAFLAVAALSAVALVTVRPARAQELLSVKVQPSVIEERIDPGGLYEGTLRVTNLSNFTQVFFPLKRDISGVANDGLPIFAEEGSKTGFEISSWIKIQSEPVTVLAKQTAELPFSVDVPEDATPGSHYGGIFMSLESSKPRETGASVGYEVATILSFRVSGDLVEDAQIREFRTDKEVYGRPSVQFMTKVENLGNAVLRPRGPIEIYNTFGKRIAVLNMNESAAAVLPKSTREFKTTWDGEGLAFGRYVAVMGLVYGDEEQRTISSTASFWILPLNIILAVLGGITALVVVIYLLVKWQIRRKLAELESATKSVHPSRLKLLEEELVHHRRGAPFSRLALITIILLVFALIFMTALFFLLA